MPSEGPCLRPLANSRLVKLLEVSTEVCEVWGNQHHSKHPAGRSCLNRRADDEYDHIFRVPLMVLQVLLLKR